MRKAVTQRSIVNMPHHYSTNEQSEKGMLRNFFIGEIQSLYWTEKYLLKTLPKIQDATRTKELKEALEDHSSVTDDHAERLVQIFEMLKETAQVRKCETMDGLIKETNHLINEADLGYIVKDAGIILMIRKMQHYQLAVYDTLIHFAKILGESIIVGILQRSLSEEKKALDVFASLAEYHINETALLESENELEDAE